MHPLLLIGEISVIFYKIYFADPSTLLSCPPLQKTFLKQLQNLISPLCKGAQASCREVLPLHGSRYYLLSLMSVAQYSGQAKNTYRKINKQMKFEFLSRVLGQGQSIFEAAQQIGIHYSTAKTIIFFHKHHHKSYRSFKLEDTAPVAAGMRAGYKESSQGKGVEVVCNSHFLRWEPRKEVKAGNISLTYLRTSKPLVTKQHPIRKNSKKSTKSSKSSTGRHVKQEQGGECGSLWDSEVEDKSDSSYVCHQ